MSALTGVQSAPLAKGLPAALQRLARSMPLAQQKLSIVTGGLDNCLKGAAADAVSALLNDLSVQGVAASLADPRTLKLWLVITPSPDSVRDLIELDREHRATVTICFAHDL